MLEPLQILAYQPRLLSAYGWLEQAIGKLNRVDRRLRDLAELKAATMTSCGYCIDLGSQIGRRRSSLTDDDLLALSDYQESELFSELEKLVLGYATAISSTPAEVSDELFEPAAPAARRAAHSETAMCRGASSLLRIEPPGRSM